MPWRSTELAHKSLEEDARKSRKEGRKERVTRKNVRVKGKKKET